MRPGAAGTAGRDYRVEPKGGRHRADNPPDPIANRLLIAACGLALVSGTCAVADAAGDGISVAAPRTDDLPSGARTSATAVRGIGEYAPAPTMAIAPTSPPVWSPEAGPVAYYGQPLPAPRTPVERTEEACRCEEREEPPAPEPAPEPEPVEEPVEAAQPIGLPPVESEPEPPAEEEPEPPLIDLPGVEVLEPTEPEPVEPEPADPEPVAP